MKGRIVLREGDITQERVDAIVNAANSRLAGGGGVDGAIHRRGGPAIMAQTDAQYPQGCPTGSAVISTAGNLKAHLSSGGGENKLLKCCRLGLPTEAADASILEAAHTPFDCRLARQLALCRRLDHRVWDSIDQARAEQGRRIPLGGSHQD